MAANINQLLKNNENIYLIPPYLMDKKDLILRAWKSTRLLNHVFLFSSGTTSKTKLKSYMISKEALFENARAVNFFLDATQSDTWLLTLPPFHIGGLSIYARASELGASVIELPNNKWNVLEVSKLLANNEISYFSIVPLQLFELLERNVVPPRELRGVFVGGDFLSNTLAAKAIKLGWPIIRTFGMTELCSQIASSYYKDSIDGFMEILPIHSIIENKIQSKSLFSGTCDFENENFEITAFQKKEFTLLDNLDLRNNDKHYLKPLGRSDESIKLKGRLLNFLELKDVIHEIFMNLNIYGRAELMLGKSKELGSILEVYIEEPLFSLENKVLADILVKLPFLKGSIQFRYFKELPRTSIGKVKRM